MASRASRSRSHCRARCVLAFWQKYKDQEHPIGRARQHGYTRSSPAATRPSNVSTAPTRSSLTDRAGKAKSGLIQDGITILWKQFSTSPTPGQRRSARRTPQLESLSKQGSSSTTTSMRDRPSAVNRSTRGGGSRRWLAGRASVIIRILCLPFFHTKKAPTNSTGSVVKRSMPIERSLLMKRTNSRLLFVNAGSK